MYHEIYGKYYKLITKLLNSGPLTKNQINNFITKYGFEESLLYLDADILVDSYNLFEEKNGIYYPKIKNKIPQLFTNEQKGLIYNILNNEKVQLFLPNERIEYYKELLNTDPLYCEDYYHYIFRDSDKDDINGYYKHKFDTINKAIRNNKNLHLTFISNKNHVTHKTVAPYKIEYSMQDQKFRLLAVEYRNKIPKRVIRVRLTSMFSCKICNRFEPIDFNVFITKELLVKKLVIEVYPQLNGIERVFIELSNYKREAEFDKERNCCVMNIYYDSADEGDLIIKMLSFGKVVKIITDCHIKEEVIRRINVQKEYFKEKEESDD